MIGIDHNLDFLKSSTHTPTHQFIDEILDLGLIPTITRPTRITHHTATLIDNILVDQRYCELYKSSMIIDNISDHLPCLTTLCRITVPRNHDKTVISRDLRKQNLASLQQNLINCDWNTIIKDGNACDKFTRFHTHLSGVIDNFCPMVDRNLKYKQIRREPWLTPGLFISIKKCKKLYKRSITVGSNSEQTRVYLAYSTSLRKIKRAAKKYYYLEKCNEFKHNTKQLWKTINVICGRSNDKTLCIDALKVESVTTYNTVKIANSFGNYFANVGQKFAQKITKSKTCVDDYLERIRLNSKSIFLVPVTHKEIDQLISQLPNKKSSGHDNISNVLLKTIKPGITEPLVEIFNLSMSMGIFPDVMKNALVVPLHKGLAKDELNNYRPISLLITISKILDKVMYSRVYNFLNNMHQIYESQYGFRAKHSCDHAIGELLSEITKSMELGKQTVCTFLNLSKAFDMLEHSVIFKKMERYGLRGPCLDWFKSYLKGRTLKVQCNTGNGVGLSDEYSIKYGTLQELCLGPLIFLIFCNDLHLHMLYLDMIQFADDTTLYMSHRHTG